MIDRLPSRQLIAFAIVALSLFHVGFLIYNVINYYPDLIHSDSAAAPLMAAEILKSGALVPDGWYHANSDVWLLNRQLLILPYIPIFGLGPSAYLAMQITFVVLLAVTSIYVLWPILDRPLHIFVATAFLAIPFSRHFYNHTYGEIAYGPLLLQMMLLAGVTVRAGTARKPLNWALLFLFLLAFLVAASNPSRFAAYVLAPTLVTLFVMRRSQLRPWGIAAALLGATVLGRAVHSHFMADLYLSRRGKDYGLDNPLSYPGDIFDFVKSLFELVDLRAVLGYGNTGLWLLSVAYTVLVLFISYRALKLLFAKFKRMAAADRLRAPRWRYRYTLLITFLVSLICISGALLVTTAPTISRIFLPPLFLAGFVLYATFTPLAFKNTKVGLVFVGILTVPLIFELASRRPVEGYLVRAERLAAELRENGVTYGYSTDFWRANVISFITAGEIKIRPLRYRDGLFIPYRGLSRQNWFLPEDVDRFAVLSADPKGIDVGKLAKFGIRHIKTVDAEDITIYLFDGQSNLARLPNWRGDDRVLQQHPLTGLTEVGVLSEDPKGVFLQNTAPGILVKGPDAPLRKGDYVLRLDIVCSDDAVASAQLHSEDADLDLSLGTICSDRPGDIGFSTDRDIFDADLRLNVSKGTVKFYGFEAH